MACEYDDQQQNVSSADETKHSIGDQNILELNKDLRKIESKLHAVTAKWQHFGLALGIDPSRLEIIKADNTDSCESCFLKTLSHWLSNEDSPTWQKIVNALCSENVNQRQLAREIEIRTGPSDSELQPNAAMSEIDATFSQMSWEKSDLSAPENILRPIDALAYGDDAYFRNCFTSTVYSFSKKTKKWDKLPDCLVEDTSLVLLPVTNGGEDTEYCLHTVGGRNRIKERQNDRDEFSSVLYHYRRNRKCTPFTWQCSDYPDMTIKRSQVTVAYNDGYVIAAGGCSDHGVVSKVEVLNIKSPIPEWSRVVSLPEPVFRASQCICNGFLYILGGNVRDESNGCFVPTKNACVTSIDKLVDSLSQDEDVFKTIEKLRLKESAFVVCRNNVVAIGGWQFDSTESKGTKLVHVYDKDNDTWIRLDSVRSLKDPRCQNFAVAFSDKMIMTVGGYENPCGLRINSIEFATLDPETVTN